MTGRTFFFCFSRKFVRNILRSDKYLSNYVLQTYRSACL